MGTDADINLTSLRNRKQLEYCYRYERGETYDY
ncbi:MAG: hypothetical protein H6Q70_267 [Firmicutes bacterium]|nr:hypothetical protein [Bacillota bacterium]